ncbi:MAG: aspartate kinase [Polyangiales bacterium]
MGHVVSKFGGTSLANAAQIRRSADIVRADARRRYVVVSAPGKRNDADQKITDLLYLCHEHALRRLPFHEVFDVIRERYLGIVKDLGLKLDLRDRLAAAQAKIAEIGAASGTPDYAASRGEAWNAEIVAELLGYPFVDAADVIFFDERGRLDEKRTYSTCGGRLRELGSAVVPGFYGSTPDGTIKTFSRGGSDVTGAIVARAVSAETYENWTDVPGMLITDPRIQPGAYTIEVVTYQELRELAYSGAKVLHEEAVFPVREAGIPVNVRNTNDPSHEGTMVVPTGHPKAKIGYNITGIAGRSGFTVLLLEKAMMNTEIGFARRVLSVLEQNGVSLEHMPTGIDTLSLVIESKSLEGNLDKVLPELRIAVEPDEIEVQDRMALIAVVGRGIARHPRAAATVFRALQEAGIHVRMIDQGSSQLNIIVGVDAAHFEDAVRAIYRHFIHDGDRPEPVS